MQNHPLFRNNQDFSTPLCVEKSWLLVRIVRDIQITNEPTSHLSIPKSIIKPYRPKNPSTQLEIPAPQDVYL